MRVQEAEKLLEALLEIDNEGPLKRDPDGDYVLSYAGAQFYARIIGEGRPVVQIFSVVAADVPPSPDLLAYMTKLNAEISYVKVFGFGNQTSQDVVVIVFTHAFQIKNNFLSVSFQLLRLADARIQKQMR